MPLTRVSMLWNGDYKVACAPDREAGNLLAASAERSSRTLESVQSTESVWRLHMHTPPGSFAI